LSKSGTHGGRALQALAALADARAPADRRGPARLTGAPAAAAQIRQALAVAGVLGRALIIPELWCGADRYWAPHAGVIPGAALQLPFRCPLDHVLDLEQCAPAPNPNPNRTL